MSKKSNAYAADPLRLREPSAIAALLFEFQSGPVHARIWGPRKGWRWKSIEYYRYVRSTRKPGSWVRVLPDRAADQLHLLRCVKATTDWLKEFDKP